MSLNQETFSHLLALQKEFEDSSTVSLGNSWSKDIRARETKDRFILDYRRSKIEIRKYSMNKRVRSSVVMVRYCSLKRHTNPDGTAFDGAHFHVYQEGFDDKVAFSVQDTLGIDPNSSSREEVLSAILKYCNIADPGIQMVIEA